MPETTAAAKAKGPSTILIVLLIVILIGGGLGAWFVLRPKDDDDIIAPTPVDKDPTGATGRDNQGDAQQNLTAAEILALMSNSSTGLGGGDGDDAPLDGVIGSETNPYKIWTPTAQALIDEMSARIQNHTESVDLIRAKYDIGQSMVGNTGDQVQAVKNMMEKLPGVDTTADKYYLSFPVYGTLETQGAKYRSNLQRIITAGWRGLNLSDARNGDAPWWLPDISLNLLVGTTSSSTPDAHTIWMGWVQRPEMQFFKGMNGLWKSDQELLKKVDGKGVYNAGGMYTWVERWVEEIDRLDKVTRWEALRRLMRPVAEGGEGLYFSFVNEDDPNTDYYKEYNAPDPSDPNATVDDSPVLNPPQT